MLNTTAAPFAARGGVHVLWLPSVLVATLMLGFLAISFSHHIRRVRRKRQMLWDYMSLQIDVKRCRISANLCNTYSMPLRQLASSVRVHLMEEPDLQAKNQFGFTLPQTSSALPLRGNLRPRGMLCDMTASNLDSRGEDFVDGVDCEDSVRIRVDLLCDSCREHLIMKPMFYISEDSQSVIMGDMSENQVTRDYIPQDHSAPTIEGSNPRPRHPNHYPSINSDDDPGPSKSRSPFVPRVPTVTVTDMSDIELDSFQQDTISIESFDHSCESLMSYGKRRQRRTKVLLSADDIGDNHDLTQELKMSSFDDSDFRDQNTLPSPTMDGNRSPVKHREFWKFFSKRSRRKSPKKTKKPVLTKQDRIVPASDVFSKSMDDINRNSFKRKDGNLYLRRQLFAKNKSVEKTATAGLDNHGRRVTDVNDRLLASQDCLKPHMSVSSDGSALGITNEHYYGNQHHHGETSVRQNHLVFVSGKQSNKSCDGVMQTSERTDVTGRVTLNQDGAYNRASSFDSSLKQSLRRLASFRESHTAPPRQDSKTRRSSSALSFPSTPAVSPRPHRPARGAGTNQESFG
ncbi:uncharacterized protein [Haliotis cracherodii]|uniref:uncharacterized protein n=1 Tax=Haliotis cracherodii TaxID=6455 RepID=UPI0039EA2749